MCYLSAYTADGLTGRGVDEDEDSSQSNSPSNLHGLERMLSPSPGSAAAGATLGESTLHDTTKPQTRASQTRVTKRGGKLFNASTLGRGSALSRSHTITAAVHVFVLTQQTNQTRADWPDWGLVTGGVHRGGGVSSGTRVHSISLSLRPRRMRMSVDGQTIPAK